MRITLSKFTRRGFLTGSAGVVAALPPQLALHQALANTVSGATTPSAPFGTVQLPRVRLRGYGAVSATFHRVHELGGPASILHIQCDTEREALLVQAKYLSDIGLLPGVEPSMLPAPHGNITAHRIAAGGLLVACAVGKEVYILLATHANDLVALCARHLPALARPHRRSCPALRLIAGTSTA